MTRMIRFPVALLLAISMYTLCVPLGGQLARADAATDRAATPYYIEGIEALGRADYAHAVQALTNAIKADGENASYRRARGVALTLSESFADAITDLERAQRLDPNDMEARLWAAAAYRMSGDVAKGASLFTMRDLPHDYANMVYNVMAMEYWQSRYQGHYQDPQTKRQVQTSQPVREALPRCRPGICITKPRGRAAAAEVITAPRRRMPLVTATGPSRLRIWSNCVMTRRTIRSCAAIGRRRWSGREMRLKAREEFTPARCASDRSGVTDILAGHRRTSAPWRWATRAGRPGGCRVVLEAPGVWRNCGAALAKFAQPPLRGRCRSRSLSWLCRPMRNSASLWTMHWLCIA